MFTILNRLRGTHSWFSKVNGAILAVLVWLLTKEPTIAIIVGLSYIAGESFGWGDWIGTLTTNRNKVPIVNEEGKNNGIRWIATKLIDPINKWREYCRVALTLRGLYWWIFVLVPLYFVSVNWFLIVAGLLVLSVGFPIACELGRRFPLNINLGKFSAKGAWESQEVYYGMIQDIVFLGVFYEWFSKF